MTTLEIEVSNVGGIEELQTSFDPGSTLIAAPNASNKTSLLKAIAFGLGAEQVPIRSGASAAVVTLRIGEKSITREARRRGVGTEISGDPWLDDPEIRAQFSPFAALLEFNELRSAVRQDTDIEEALKGPIDFDSLERKRSDLLQKKQRLKREREQLSDIESRLAEKTAALEDARERRGDLQETLETLEEKHEPQTVDEELESLRNRRTELLNQKQQAREQVEATEAAIERYENEQADLLERIEDLESEVAGNDVDSLRKERNRLQSEMEELTDRVEILQSVLTANREMLNSDYTGILGSEHSLAGDDVTCWNCGEMTAVSDIDSTLEDLQELVKQEKEKRREQRPAIEALKEDIDDARRTESTLEKLRSEQRQISERIGDRKSSLETQRSRLADIEANLESVTDEIEDRKSERAAEGADIADSIEETRVELQTLDREISRLEDTRDSFREDLTRRDTLDTEIEDLTADIEEITERLENMERRLREQFNQAMEDLLEDLNFDGIERIWLDGEFEIVVAREVDGAVQEDSVSNLAESERELVGLVLGLSGYLAYGLAETVPVLVLDSLGALDNARVERLLTYFRDIPEFLIAAVHPDTADSFDDDSVVVLRSAALAD
ncbi:archaea-specific SMC-related protein [Haloarchaeobius sp. DYHT-AS-18]|uniref:archaea-specific SMC-related protein n=1 Tax=Haloarchaeobius sp. DYHT-AS-18 TaxID=3446117 RepID=UPI003EB81CDD